MGWHSIPLAAGREGLGRREGRVHVDVWTTNFEIKTLRLLGDKLKYSFKKAKHLPRIVFQDVSTQPTHILLRIHDLQSQFSSSDLYKNAQPRYLHNLAGFWNCTLLHWWSYQFSFQPCLTPVSHFWGRETGEKWVNLLLIWVREHQFKPKQAAGHKDYARKTSSPTWVLRHAPTSFSKSPFS